MKRCAFLLFVGLMGFCKSCIIEPGPMVKQTFGEVWPKPRHIEYWNDYFIVRPSTFRFQAIGEDCLILQSAFQRYWGIISSKSNFDESSNTSSRAKTVFDASGYLDSVDVRVLMPCTDDEYPKDNVDEQYSLHINASLTPNGLINSYTVWGALRALETFSQLLYQLPSEDGLVRVNFSYVSDSPRFSFRGLMLDTSRHYLPLDILKTNLDAMAYNKMNIFHWHIVDDHSFPYQSVAFPQLSEAGAYHPVTKIYTPIDIRSIVEYARLRGIRVIPEFDTPGHTRSWGEGLPELLTPCYILETQTKYYGPIDPTKNTTFPILETLFREISQLFPDDYIHLGAEEVGYECWATSEDLKDFMDQNNITSFKGLEDYYIQNLINMTNRLNIKSIVWEDVFHKKLTLPSTTIIDVWKEDWQQSIFDSTAAGFPTILSHCYYLNDLADGGDWQKFYDCEPNSFNGTFEQKKFLLGGETCMWAENVNEHNVIQRVWPRASAVAEKLWSEENADDLVHVARRLEEHTCRMNQRAIAAAPPNGPGTCYF